MRNNRIFSVILLYLSAIFLLLPSLSHAFTATYVDPAYTASNFHTLSFVSRSLEFDQSGNMYVVDVATDNSGITAILRLDAYSNFTTSSVYVSYPMAAAYINGLHFDSGGNLFVSYRAYSGDSGHIDRIDASSLIPITYFVIPDPRPTGLSGDASGALYFIGRRQSDPNFGNIYKIDSAGIFMHAIIGGVVGKGIAVDNSGNIFVSNMADNSIYKYDALTLTPALIATFDTTPGELTFDNNGNLYAIVENATFTASEIIKLSLVGTPPPVLEEVNTANTFGQVESLAPFQGSLFAGTRADQLWKSSNGTTFSDISNPSLYIGNPRSLIEFNNELYLLGYGASPYNSASVWKSSDGINFTNIISDGFGDSNNIDIPAYALFNGKLFAGTRNDGTTGGEVWNTTDGINWSQTGADGLGNPNNTRIGELVEFNGYLYAGTRNDTEGAYVYRKYPNQPWEMVVGGNGNSYGGANSASGFGNGAGNPLNERIFASAVFNGYLYLGIKHPETSTSPASLWRTSDGINWNLINGDGFGNPNNNGIDAMQVYNNRLYVGTINSNQGAELWSSSDGQNWTLIDDNGFGNAIDNTGVRSMAVYNGYLYIGAGNGEFAPLSRGEIFRYLDSVNADVSLANISTRGSVQTGDNVMIGGFIISGTAPRSVLIRGFGPTLADFGVTGAMANPYIELYSGQTMIATNDNWQTPITQCDAPAVSCGTPLDIQATGKDACSVATTGCSQDAAILVTLPPGAYTAIMRGVNNGTGVGLVGIDEIGP